MIFEAKPESRFSMRRSKLLEFSVNWTTGAPDLAEVEDNVAQYLAEAKAIDKRRKETPKSKHDVFWDYPEDLPIPRTRNVTWISTLNIENYDRNELEKLRKERSNELRKGSKSQTSTIWSSHEWDFSQVTSVISSLKGEALDEARERIECCAIYELARESAVIRSLISDMLLLRALHRAPHRCEKYRGSWNHLNDLLLRTIKRPDYLSLILHSDFPEKPWCAIEESKRPTRRHPWLKGPVAVEPIQTAKVPASCEILGPLSPMTEEIQILAVSIDTRAGRKNILRAVEKYVRKQLDLWDAQDLRARSTPEDILKVISARRIMALCKRPWDRAPQNYRLYDGESPWHRAKRAVRDHLHSQFALPSWDEPLC
jgi:hypothetical protein